MAGSNDMLNSLAWNREHYLFIITCTVYTHTQTETITNNHIHVIFTLTQAYTKQTQKLPQLESSSVKTKMV